MPDEPDDVFARGLQMHLDVKRERDQLTEMLTTLQRDHALIADQLEGARKAIDQLSSERDWYLRRCTELETHFTTFASLAAEALHQRATGPHLPMSYEPETGEPPIPKFLTEGFREMATQAANGKTNP